MKYVITLIVAALLSLGTGYTIAAATTAQIEPVKVTEAYQGQPAVAMQVQGGIRQTIQQPNATIDELQPASIVLQGNSEDTDGLQPTILTKDLQ